MVSLTPFSQSCFPFCQRPVPTLASDFILRTDAFAAEFKHFGSFPAGAVPPAAV
jgi:hypothetical protein